MRIRVTALGAVVGTCLALMVAAPSEAAAEPAPLKNAQASGRDDRYVVVLKDGAARDAAVKRARREGGEVLKTYSHVLNGYSAELSADELAEVRSDPAVAYVQADAPIELKTNAQVNPGVQTPTSSWGLDRIDQHDKPLDGRYGYDGDATGGTIYIVDDGLRPTHTEFGDRAENVYVAPIAGTDGAECPTHGTMVASAAAGTDTGVAKGAKIKGVRVMGCDNFSTQVAIVDALEWIGATAPAGSVANISLGTPANTDATAVSAAVEGLIDAGVVVVVAAGNEGKYRCDNGFASARAIVVGATNENDRRAPFSNFGCVGIWAPGDDVAIALADNDNAGGIGGGTSFAAPYVAGVAARYRQAHPQATPAQVRAALDASATAGLLWDIGTTSPNRLLFAEPGTGAGDTTVPAAPGTPSAAGVRYDSLNLTWPAATDDVRVASYEVQSATADGAFSTITRTGTPKVKITDLTPATGYRFRIRARDTAGNWSAFSAALAVTTAGADTTAPSVPGGLTVANLVSSSLILRWTASTDGEEGSGVAEYEAQQAVGPGAFSTVGTSTAPYLAVSGLTPGTTYRFRIRVRDGVGNWSAFSDAVTATTSAANSACQAKYTLTRVSTTEFSAFVNLLNTGTAAFAGGWTLTFDLPEGQSLKAGTNVTATAQGQRVTITGTKEIGAPSGSFVALFTGTGAGTAKPAAFTLNGVSCTIP